MADSVGSKVTYFLVGLGLGALVGVLFAPKAGDETRDYLSKARTMRSAKRANCASAPMN